MFSYGTKLDYLLILLCAITSVGSGVAFPLMTVVFGELLLDKPSSTTCKAY